jgi:hypothetical protein
MRMKALIAVAGAALSLVLFAAPPAKASAKPRGVEKQIASVDTASIDDWLKKKSK